MSEKFSWSLKVLLASGPPIEVSDSFEVDAIDIITYEIPAADPAAPPAAPAFGAAKSAKLDIQPGAKGKVKFVAVTSSVYDDKLTYEVDGGNPVVLNHAHLFVDQRQLFIGKGVNGELDKPPKVMEFFNAIWDKDNVPGGQPATVQIVVGREAKQ